MFIDSSVLNHRQHSKTSRN
jgi:phosphoglycerate kinase